MLTPLGSSSSLLPPSSSCRSVLFSTALLFLDNCPLIPSPISYCFQLKSHYRQLSYSRNLNRSLSFSFLPFQSTWATAALSSIPRSAFLVGFPAQGPPILPHCITQRSPSKPAVCRALDAACGMNQGITSRFSVKAMSAPVPTGLLLPSAPRWPSVPPTHTVIQPQDPFQLPSPHSSPARQRLYLCPFWFTTGLSTGSRQCDTPTTL